MSILAAAASAAKGSPRHSVSGPLGTVSMRFYGIAKSVASCGPGSSTVLSWVTLANILASGHSQNRARPRRVQICQRDIFWKSTTAGPHLSKALRLEIYSNTKGAIIALQPAHTSPAAAPAAGGLTGASASGTFGSAGAAARAARHRSMRPAR